MPLDEVLGVEELLRSTVAEPRFRAVVLNGFAALALLLAVIGIYGVIAYAVEQRTRETGVRVALGARASDVILVLVGEGVRSAALGALFGLAGAWALGQALSPFLFEVGSTDALTFGGVSVLILVVALTASYLPARRAAQVDPVEALRAD
jgi:putative ABC transport system permease protein